MFVCILFYMYIIFTKINELFFHDWRLNMIIIGGKKWKVMEYLSDFFFYIILHTEN